mgnify:CR=1 FL=1
MKYAGDPSKWRKPRQELVTPGITFANACREKEQARAAFKRYLQLAPSAGDAEQIRGRMERL